MSRILVVSLSMIVFFNVQAQDSLQIQGIEGHYEKLIVKNSKWEKFRVVPQVNVEEFQKLLSQEVSMNKEEIERYEASAEQSEKDTQALIGEKEILEEQLANSQLLNDTIVFLGINFDKSVYHALVWIIVGILIVLVAIIYGLYMRSHQVTKSATKDLEDLKAEFEAHRDKAREKETKLKRELQTAMNTLHEKGIRVS